MFHRRTRCETRSRGEKRASDAGGAAPVAAPSRAFALGVGRKADPRAAYPLRGSAGGALGHDVPSRALYFTLTSTGGEGIPLAII
jgi:hypothetical protein